MTTVEILKKARALIETPEKWTREADARNARGEVVDIQDPDATCFCALGAMRAAWFSVHPREGWADRPTEYATAVELLRLGTSTISMFNDDPATTHVDVLAAFDKAIALAEASAGESKP